MIRHHTRLYTAIIAAGLMAGSVGSTLAQPVFKSIDAEGQVTYSETPPPPSPGERVEELQLQPGPPPEDEQAARQRLNASTAESSRITQQREAQQRTREKAIETAQRQLDHAQAELEQAEVPRDSDWQHLAKGGRVLKPIYRERLSAAKEKVREAEAALQAARSGR